jgi:uncharacterized C2H2 Zn-finger protein
MLQSKPICPICQCICKDDDDKHRHIEEKHDNLAGKNTELLEKTDGKEVLHG